MMDPGRVLSEALVRAYRPHVLRTAESRGWTVDPEMAEAIDRGEAWLSETLGDLLSQPYREQRRGPLEVFQEAMLYPTEALSSAGVEPVDRDPTAEAAIPGDVYDLAPASSALLGEQVWQAHLAWGAAKAAAITQASDDD